MLLQSSVGIDIGKDSVSIAYLKTPFKRVRLAAHLIHPLAKEAPAEQRHEIVGELIRDFMMKNRVKSAGMFLGLPRDAAIIRFIEFPLAVKKNLGATLHYEMVKYIPISVDDIYFDYHVLSEDKMNNRLKVLLIALKKEDVSPYLELGNSLGVGISGIEIDSTAIANYFSYGANTPAQNGGAYAVIYVNGDYLGLNLIREMLLHYSRSVDVGGERSNLCTLILKELKLLRKALGQEQGILEVVLCDSRSDGALFSSLKEEADLSIHPVDLTRTGIPSSALIPAFALALRGIRKVPIEVNLLPTELRKRPSKVPYTTMFALVGLLFLSGLSWGGSHILHQRLKINRLNAELGSLGTEIGDIDRIQKRCREREDRIDSLSRLFQSKESVLDVLKELSQVIPESAWVQDLDFSEDRVTLIGYAESASELIPLLEASALFKNAAFVSAITKQKDGKERFKIVLKIE